MREYRKNMKSIELENRVQYRVALNKTHRNPGDYMYSLHSYNRIQQLRLEEE